MKSRMYPSDCTIYLRQGETSYLRAEVDGCQWVGTKAANFNATGVKDVDSVSVSIPLDNADLSMWGPSDTGYIVQGIWTDEITDIVSFKNFLAKKPLTVTSVAKCNWAIAIGGHWKVGAK